MLQGKKIRLGIVGTGFVARGLTYLLQHHKSLMLSKVLTRRKIDQVLNLAADTQQITNSIEEFIKHSDLVVECTGDSVYATDVLSRVMDNGIPVVTMDSELQVTSGSWLMKKGFITEAEGDQPGSLVALYKESLEMGFKPLVLGNIKGFLNHSPSPKDMKFWSRKNGISLEQVTSFTDGTKLQIEQTLVANGLGFDIARRGLIGIKCDDYQEGAKILARKADELGKKISDYVLSSKSPAGVFVVARHDKRQASYLKYLKLGEGPYYVLTRPFHLCHLEILKTVRQVLKGEKALLNNSFNPKISVATITKKKLNAGYFIKRGIGSFDVRGEAVDIKSYPNHVPIGLMFNTTIKKNIQPNQVITFNDVEVPESQALRAWLEIIK